MTEANKDQAKPAQNPKATMATIPVSQSALSIVLEEQRPPALRTTVGMLVMHAWLSRKEETPHSLARKVAAYTDAFLKAMQVEGAK